MSLSTLQPSARAARSLLKPSTTSSRSCSTAKTAMEKSCPTLASESCTRATALASHSRSALSTEPLAERLDRHHALRGLALLHGEGLEQIRRPREEAGA